MHALDSKEAAMASCPGSRVLGSGAMTLKMWTTCLWMLIAPLHSLTAQMAGTLSGRIVFTSAGHGWTYDNWADVWSTQRGDNNEIVEDYGNLDQMNLFVDYCFNAGGTVVPLR